MSYEEMKRLLESIIQIAKDERATEDRRLMRIEHLVEAGLEILGNAQRVSVFKVGEKV